MEPEKDGDDRRKPEHMHAVEAKQGPAAHVRAAAQDARQKGADGRDGAHHVRSDHRCPVGFLVPGQQVSRESEAERHQEEEGAGDPVQLPRILVGTGDEDPEHVQQDGHDHEVPCPEMDAPQHPAEGDLELKLLDASIGLGFGRDIVARQEQARQHQDQEEREGDAAEAVEIIDPSRHGLVQDAAMPAGKTQAVVEIADQTHTGIVIARSAVCDEAIS